MEIVLKKGETEMFEQDMQSVGLNQSYQYLFTVFTATYNRAHTLPRVYESLKAQTYRDFEWLIVDDGSTDHTQELVEQWQKEKQFSIRYVYQENGGLHIATNHGVREAKGELFLQLDSDDACIPQALERFKYHWDAISSDQKEKFSAVTCLCKDQNGEIIGSHFPFDVTDSDSLEICYRFKVTGEKWGFHRTDILRQFPDPDDTRGIHFPPNLKWHKIARKYKTRFVNEVLRIYWIGGPSMTSDQNPRNRAFGNHLYNLTVLNQETDWFYVAPLSFLRSAVNYSRFSFHLGKKISDQFTELNTVMGKTLWLIALPLAYFVYFNDNSLTNN